MTASIVVLVILLSTALKTGYGSICAFGVCWISFACPLGFLEVALASKNLLPGLFISVALVVLSVVIFGRFFCAWICPTALVRDVFGGRGVEPAKEMGEGKDHALIQPNALDPSNPRRPQAALTKISWALNTRYAILGGTLLSSFLFGFPVFCAICPIGLFFGSLFAVTRLFSAQQPSWELLLFPALLGLELFALKSWCRSICPLGALLGLMGALNRFLQPTVLRDKCYVSKGINCRVCKKECPEGIDLIHDHAGAPLRDCTKCLECYEKCPARAIRIAPLI